MSERISADRAGTFSQAFRAKAKGLGVNAYTCLPPPPGFAAFVRQHFSSTSLLRFVKVQEDAVVFFGAQARDYRGKGG